MRAHVEAVRGGGRGERRELDHAQLHCDLGLDEIRDASSDARRPFA